MKILLRNVRIIDNRLSGHEAARDLLIEDGVIAAIDTDLSAPDAEVIEYPDLCVSIGWMDLRANFRDPGSEQKETLDTGLAAAANGGFTAVALSPDNSPPTDNKGAVKYLLERGRQNIVELFPIGALSQKLEGNLLSEMYDMHLSGAVGFSDDRHPVKKSGIMERALRYARNFGGTVFSFPNDATLRPKAQINESPTSVQLGMPGIPDIAEEMQVIRDLKLLEYSDGGKLHIGPLSAASAVKQVKMAKSSHGQLSADVTAYHLLFTEEDLMTFDSNLKVMPPFRSKNDREALRNAVAEGIIDVISSDHMPEDIEHKNVEFEHAGYGIAGIETFFPAVMTAMKDKLPLDELVATFSINPRRILNLPVPEIKVGNSANLTLFLPDEACKIDADRLKTMGVNNPLTGKSLSGKVIGIIRDRQFVKSSW